MPFYPAQPEMLALSRDLLEPYQESQYNRLYITPYGSHTRHSDDLAAYFLPNAGRQIICGEWGSLAAVNGTIDVLANYFNVLTAPLPTAPNPITLSNYIFQSAVDFAPTQQQTGAALSYRRQLSEYIDEGFWFEAILPIANAGPNAPIAIANAAAIDFTASKLEVTPSTIVFVSSTAIFVKSKCKILKLFRLCRNT